MSDTPRTDAIAHRGYQALDLAARLCDLSRELEREIARLREDAATLCSIIDHADPTAWHNGNTHPDRDGPDEGAMLMSQLYSPLRAEYARAAKKKA